MPQILICLLALLFWTSGPVMEGNADFDRSPFAAKGGVSAARDAIALADKIKASGMTTRQAGEFFGWKGAELTKPLSSFTRQSLEAAGWTREQLANVANAYREIAKITPQNPAAPVRAQQLESLLELFK